MATLYIIGNGFDLAHGLPTRYCDFREWLIKNKHQDVVEKLESYYPLEENKDYKWSNFEDALGKPWIEDIYNDNKDNCINPEDSDNIKEFCSEITSSIEERFGSETQQIPNLLTEWIKTANKKLATTTPINIPLFETNGYYLNFNYTTTLENLYHIDRESILHIHGHCIDDKQVIVGFKEVVALGNETFPDTTYEDDAVAQIKRIAESLKKPIEELINNNKNFFERLTLVDKVVVYGHSLNDIDFEYFKQVHHFVGNAPWFFEVYAQTNKELLARLNSIDAFIYKLGLMRDRCFYIVSNNCGRIFTNSIE